jgi:cytidylate kinase
MAVITISREMGSEGDKIAELLCEQLDYCRMDKAMLMQVAKEAGVDPDAITKLEKSFTKRARLVSDEMTSLYRKQSSAFEKRGAVDDKTYAQVVQETMEELAGENNVLIVGRGGQMVLRDWPNALHVRLYAPVEVRVQRLVERDGMLPREAERRIKQSDEQKRQYIRHMFRNADWRNLKHYHLAIDTGRVSPEAAAQMIMLAAQGIDER